MAGVEHGYMCWFFSVTPVDSVLKSMQRLETSCAQISVEREHRCRVPAASLPSSIAEATLGKVKNKTSHCLCSVLITEFYND